MILVWQPLNLGKNCTKPTCHHPSAAHSGSSQRNAHTHTESQTLQTCKRIYSFGALWLHNQELRSWQTRRRQEAASQIQARGELRMPRCHRSHPKGCSNCLWAQRPGLCPAGLKQRNRAPERKGVRNSSGQIKELCCYSSSGETVSSVTFVTCEIPFIFK